MGSRETPLQDAIRVSLSYDAGAVFWRNNVGLAVHADGSRVRYGLATGSADLIGLVDGRFCAIEVKAPGRYPSEEQRLFLALVRERGGFAAVVRSAEEAHAAIARCRAGESR